MQIKFYNCPEPQKFEAEAIKEQPNFLSYRPDFVAMQKLTEQFRGYSKIVVIGHGGSITSFEGMYYALQEKVTKQAFFVSTVDPDYLAKIKQLTTPEDTVVVAISKSGQTVTQLEALAQFLDYPLVVVTGVAGPLADIAHVQNAKVLIHPPIGGRFTGLTEVGLLPAMLCGLDVEEIYRGAQKIYADFNQDNLAYQAANVFWQLEQQGIVDVFMPIYSEAMRPFANLIIQLCHESFGKDGKGQTYFAHEAPESQHHTNQRFFGGRKNIAGWFISNASVELELATNFPDNLKNIALGDKTLGDLNGLRLADVLQYEKQGTLEDAQLSGLPVVDMMLARREEFEVGQFLAFWQLYAVYSSWLRGVNSFDQPQVENSKKISFAKRLANK